MSGYKYFLIILLMSLSCVSIAADKIDTTQTIMIGGIKQFITIKGTDRTKPLLLFLHGGPGGSLVSYANIFTGKLQKSFCVVQWDQRETGNTLKLNPSPVPLTVELMSEDAHQVIQLLLKQFNQQKLYLVGYSFGTVLGFQVVKKYPGLIASYFAVSPMVNQAESEAMTIRLLKENATAENNNNATEELKQVQIPFQNADQLFYARKWLYAYTGDRIPDRLIASRKQYFNEWSKTWLALFNEGVMKDLFIDLPSIGCPVIFLLGRKDYQTHYAIAEKYFTQLQAPDKKLYWFEKSGHTVPLSEPGIFQDIILNYLKLGKLNE
jgi:pimeloyl-ACP methyl ester carboxylesterase